MAAVDPFKSYRGAMQALDPALVLLDNVRAESAAPRRWKGSVQEPSVIVLVALSAGMTGRSALPAMATRFC